MSSTGTVPPASESGARGSRSPDPDVVEVRFEPIVDLSTGRTAGAEALMRRRTATGALQLAARFLPHAELSGLILPLGRRVLDEACGHAAAWDALCPGVIVAVNLSARQLADPTLPDWVRAVLVRHALPADRLVLDVAESVVERAVHQRADGLSRLRELVSLGVGLAVDDVGTGSGDTAYLSAAPATMLKLDGRVTRGVQDDPANCVRLVELAHRLGMQALGEGLEQMEDVTALRAAGCDLGQGYALGRTMDAASITQLLS